MSHARSIMTLYRAADTYLLTWYKIYIYICMYVCMYVCITHSLSMLESESGQRSFPKDLLIVFWHGSVSSTCFVHQGE